MLRDADQIVVLTGAGISTESGIPDFRGPNGVWTKNPAAEKTATLQYYMRDPEVRRARVAEPARQRDVAARAQRRAPRARRARAQGRRSHTLVTQNVDGLHHAAGQSPEIVVEIHGNVREAKCMPCGWRGPMDETLDRVRAGEDDPACLECGGILKSATISFGENLVPEDLDAGAARGRRRRRVPRARHVARRLPGRRRCPRSRCRNGATLVILNAEATPFDRRRRRRASATGSARSSRPRRRGSERPSPAGWEYPTAAVAFNRFDDVRARRWRASASC